MFHNPLLLVNFKNAFYLLILWQLKCGVVPIINKNDFFSCANSEKPYKLGSSLIKYGGCSLVAERVVVVRKTRVRFSPSTLFEEKRMKNKLAIARRLDDLQLALLNCSLNRINIIIKLNAENSDKVGFGANQ